MKNLKLLLFTIIIALPQCLHAQLTQYSIGSSGNELATCIVYDQADGSAIIGGYSYDLVADTTANTKMLLIKVTSGGSIAWQKSFGITGKNSLLQDVILTHDGNIVIAGMARDGIYAGNIAMVVKVNIADGSMMWQNSISASPTNPGGEVFYGVAELGSAANYNLVCVGTTYNVPGYTQGLISVFKNDGTFLYDDVYNFNSSGFFRSLAVAADSTDVYITANYPGDYTDVGMLDYTPGTTSGTLNWAKYFDFYENTTEQDNFFGHVYVEGSKLVVEGGSLTNYTTTGGAGQFIMTLNAADGSGAQIRSLQNSGLPYANNSTVAPVSADKIYTIQSPSGSWYDATVWTSGITTNTVITPVTSLSSMTYESPVKFSSSDSGEHSINQAEYLAGTLYMAGMTNTSVGFGNNDIYYVVADTTLASVSHTCDTAHDIAAMADVTPMDMSPTVNHTTLTTTTYTATETDTHLDIKKLCGDAPVDSGGYTCNTLSLPDTLDACRDGLITLDATLVGSDSVASISWWPHAGLTDTGSLVTTDSVTASGYYYITVMSIIPENLVINGDFSAGNTGFTNDYSVMTGLTYAGGYDIVTDASTHNPGLWPAIGDHTTGTGYMMVVDASTSPGSSIWCQTISVTPNTYYSLSAWAALLYPPGFDLVFTINGAEVGYAHPCTADTGIWAKYGTMWYSGASTSATICISDSNTTAYGNDFALDDISFSPLCVAKDSVFIAVQSMSPHIDTAASPCGNEITFTGSDGSDGIVSWAWTFGDGDSSMGGTSTHTYTTTGTYTVTMVETDSTGCKDTVTMNAIVSATGTTAAAGGDTSVCKGQHVQLSASGGVAYTWNPPATLNNASIADPIAAPSVTTTYTVTVTDSNGCTATDTVTVGITPGHAHILASNDTTVCHGIAVQLGAYGGVSYVWTPGSGLSTTNAANPTATPGITTTYIVTGTDSLGCIGSDSVTVTITSGPQLYIASPGTVSCENKSVQLTVSGAGRYYWTPAEYCDNPDIGNPVVSPDITTWFYVTGIDDAGCSSEDSVLVTVQKDGYISMPNAFTPNNDGLNDKIYPSLYCGFVLESFSVYNRWGQRVFYTTTPNDGWDGRFNNVPQPLDVFDYYILGHEEGSTKQIMYKGNITLVR